MAKSGQAELPALVHVMSGEYVPDAVKVWVYGKGDVEPDVEVRFYVLDGPVELGDAGQTELLVRSNAEGVATVGVCMREVGQGLVVAETACSPRRDLNGI